MMFLFLFLKVKQLEKYQLCVQIFMNNLFIYLIKEGFNVSIP